MEKEQLRMKLRSKIRAKQLQRKGLSHVDEMVGESLRGDHGDNEVTKAAAGLVTKLVGGCKNKKDAQRTLGQVRELIAGCDENGKTVIREMVMKLVPPGQQGLIQQALFPKQSIEKKKKKKKKKNKKKKPSSETAKQEEGEEPTLLQPVSTTDVVSSCTDAKESVCPAASSSEAEPSPDD